MKPWTTITNHLSAIPFALTIALACGPISADDLRVKVGQGSQLEIRCDGSVAAVLENRTGEVKNLDPGVYILRVVEGASLYRAEPLLAGIVSSPMSAVTLIAPSALSNTSGNWVVELVRTPSEENASRAEQAAKVQVKGKIQTVQKDGAFVVQMGPFPNRYLAQQGLQKAQGYGFPARIRELGGAEGMEEPLASISPRAFRRLTPKGSGRSIQPPPPVDLQAEVTDAPPPKRMTIEVPAEPPMGQEPNIELDPLPLFSEEDLALEPVPSEPEEDILVEPFAEPQQEELQPDLGLVPAPMARQKSSPQPIKISPATPRGLSRPPQYSQGPPSQNRRPPMNQGPRNVRPLGPRPAPAPDLRTMPRPDQEFQAKDPEVARAPQPRPEPVAPEPKNLPPEMPPPQSPTPKSEPPQPPSAPPSMVQSPRPQAPAPQVSAGADASREPDLWVPERQPTKGSRVLRSIPFIRKWSWQKPLVEPPRADFMTPEDQFAKALQGPADEKSALGPRVPGTEGETIPYAPDMVEKTRVAESMPAAPDLKSGTSVMDNESIAATTEEQLLVPYQPPQTAELPDDAESVTSIEDLRFDSSSAIVPPAPGENGSKTAPLFNPDETTPSDTLTKSTDRTAISGQPRLFSLPALGPVRRAYVQLFTEQGDPVTEPAAHLDLAAVSSSRLEFNGHGYSGSFQAYAPTEDQVVLVNVTDLEDYVAGILPEEISPEAPVEVLKAQAVLIRGYALVEAAQGLYAAYGFDLEGDANATWPYLGTDSVTPAIRRAVDETESEILIDSAGNLATPVYCFSSGGYLADAQSIWGGTGDPVPAYLTARPDFDPADVPEFKNALSGFATDEDLLEDWLQSTPNTYDRDAAGSYFRWEVRFTDEEMNQIVNAYWNGTVGEVKSVEITRRAISGHAIEMEIRGSNQTVTARSSDMIREALNLNSSLIVLKERFGPGGGWIIYGGGLGHGVGLSQCGAIGLAERKQANYKKMLNYYFEGLRLGRRTITRARSGA